MPFLSGGNYLNVVRLELRIRCYDGNPFALGLGHEKAIKRVAMMERQVRYPNGVAKLDGDRMSICHR